MLLLKETHKCVSERPGLDVIPTDWTVNQVLTGRRSAYANDLLPSYRKDLHFFTARVISFLIIAKGSFNERCLIVNGQMSRWSALSINYTRAHAPPRPWNNRNLIPFAAVRFYAISRPLNANERAAVCSVLLKAVETCTAITS